MAIILEQLIKNNSDETLNDTTIGEFDNFISKDFSFDRDDNPLESGVWLNWPQISSDEVHLDTDFEPLDSNDGYYRYDYRDNSRAPYLYKKTDGFLGFRQKKSGDDGIKNSCGAEELSVGGTSNYSRICKCKTGNIYQNNCLRSSTEVNSDHNIVICEEAEDGHYVDSDGLVKNVIPITGVSVTCTNETDSIATKCQEGYYYNDDTNNCEIFNYVIT